jgi:hypothetical protein
MIRKKHALGGDPRVEGENRSIKLRARYGSGLKQIGPLRFRFGGMFAHTPRWRASSLIQSASYPRSASNIACGSSALTGLPPNRTYPGHHKADANDPKAEFECESRYITGTREKLRPTHP